MAATLAFEIISDNTPATKWEHHIQWNFFTKFLSKIWEWAIIYKNHLSAAHIPGKLNTVADKEFQSNHVDNEWMLQSKFLNLALEHLCFKPEIYLFATNINTQQICSI